MPTMFITNTAARNFTKAFDPDMPVPIASEILRQSALNAVCMEERTSEGDYFYRADDLGGRFIVRDGDPDYGLVAVAFVRDRRSPRVDPVMVEEAKKKIYAMVHATRLGDAHLEARKQVAAEAWTSMDLSPDEVQLILDRRRGLP